MRTSRKLAAFAAFFVIAAAVAGCGSSIAGNSVASVAGNPITLQAVNHWMYVAAKDEAAEAAEEGETEPVIVPNDPPEFASCIKQIRTQVSTLATATDSELRSDCDEVFKEDVSEVMSFLIEGYWYQADAYKLGIRYTSADLTRDFNKAKKESFPTEADYESYLTSSGETHQDLLFQIRVNQIYAMLLKRYEKPVNAAAIKTYYDAHKSQFGTKATRDVHLVRTTSEAKAKAALSALDSGQSWDVVAKQYSEDASARKDGGVLNGVTSGEEEQAVSKAIFANPVNKLVGPIKGIFGWYVLEVTKATAGTQESLAKATSTIKSLLTEQEQTSAESKVNALSKKNWHSQTICRSTYQVTDCANYKAPKTTTATTTTASTTVTSTVTTATSTATTTTAASTTTTSG